MIMSMVPADRLQDRARSDAEPPSQGMATARAAPGARRDVATAPELAIIVPTLNERDNIEPLLASLTTALAGIAWEVMFVDDDSKDGTWELLRELQRRRPQVRALRRIGRYGLA
jgi:dolichol-phosphate mannosyltransferase